MKLNDVINTVKENSPRARYTDVEIVVNVSGYELPIENVKIRNGKVVIIISASALEDRQEKL